MKIVAILQNQWFKDPAHVRQIFERHPDKRNELVARFLFRGCKTGKVLRRVFGDDLCDRIVWEEASPYVGGESGASFPFNVLHIYEFIKRERPKVVLAFGVTAANGVLAVMRNFEMQCREERLGFLFIVGPHPAARGAHVESRLRDVAVRLKAEIAAMLPPALPAGLFAGEEKGGAGE